MTRKTNLLLRLIQLIQLLVLYLPVRCNQDELTLSALEDLYSAMDGPNWDWKMIQKGDERLIPGESTVPWNFTKFENGTYIHSPCTPGAPHFAAVLCNCSGMPFFISDHTMCGIMLPGGAGVVGTIPPSIGNMTNILALLFNSPGITGTIPPEIGKLTQVQYLDFAFAALTGSVPEEIGQLQYLLDFHTAGAYLTGRFPEFFGYMPNLRMLGLEGAITGPIPDSFCKGPRILKYFFLGNNHLTGTIPECIGEFPVQDIILSNNYLTGTIPASLGKLHDARLLLLSGNNFMGTLPPELGNMSSLQTLSFFNNSLTGTLPVELGNMLSVNVIDLQLNSFTGVIPAEWGNLPKISEIDLAWNSLTGTIPVELQRLCTVLSVLSLEYNYLDIDLARLSWMASLTKLQELDLGNNQGTRGTLPKWINGLKSLQYLGFEDLSLSGPLIPELFDLPGIAQISLGNNQLSGTIPETIGNLKKMAFLILSTNRFSGSLPSQLGYLPIEILLLDNNNFENVEALGILGNISTLKTLDISLNNFHGTIPASMFKGLTNLEVFAAGSNCFSGSLPQSICESSKLETLVLSALTSGKNCRYNIWNETLFRSVFNGFWSKNFLDGTIPQCLFALPKLVNLYADGNGVGGSIPPSISPSLENISLAYNALVGTLPAQLWKATNRKLLDLKNNRFDGNLDLIADMSSMSLTNLSLSINYLSGTVPRQLLGLKHIDILEGNVFNCQSSVELPPEDPQKNTYVCGATSYDESFYLFIVIVCFMAVVAWVIHKDPKVMAEFQVWTSIVKDKVTIRAIGDQSIQTVNIAKFSLHCDTVKIMTLKISALLVIVLIVYLCLSGGESRLLEHSYTWVTTAAYLTGNAATICLMIFGMCTCIFLLHSMGYDSNYYTEIDNEELRPKKDISDSFIAIPFFRVVVLSTFLIGVMIFGNAEYLIILFRSSAKQRFLVQAIFSLFKMVWAYVVTPKLFNSNYLLFDLSHDEHEKFLIRTVRSKRNFMFVMYTIMTFFLPVFVQMIIDPACFYNSNNIFVAAPQSQVEYSTTYSCSGCSYFPGNVWYDHLYNTLMRNIRTVQFQPPFVYNYTCSAAILKAYTPIYGLIYSFLLFLRLTNILLLRYDVHRNSDSNRNATVPSDADTNRDDGDKKTASDQDDKRTVAKEDEKGDEMGMFDKFNSLFLPFANMYLSHARRKKLYKERRDQSIESPFPTGYGADWMSSYLIVQLGDILMLLCMGFIAPFLGFVVMTRILLDTYVQQLVLGRFLQKELRTIEYYMDSVRPEGSGRAFDQKPSNKLSGSPKVLEALKKRAEDVDEPWGAIAAVADIEGQCASMRVSPLYNSRKVFAWSLVIIVALLVTDVYNSSPGSHTYGMYPGLGVALTPLLYVSVRLVWKRTPRLRATQSASINDSETKKSGTESETTEIEMSDAQYRAKSEDGEGDRNPIHI